MATIIQDPIKKVPNVIPSQRYRASVEPFKFSNLSFPFVKTYGPKTFGSLNKILVGYKEIKLPVPGEGLPRVIHYCADQSGCAFWRLLWPSEELLAHNKAVVMTLYQMVTIGQFYGGIDAVRLQRQCTEPQLEFIKFLRTVSDDMKKKTGKGFRIIWEVDDLVLPYEDLPQYNVCVGAFSDKKIELTVKEVMKYVDEMTVPTEHMRQHYKKHLNFDKISVIPNYAPKNWIDRGYDRERVLENYRKHSNKPRVLYAGSGTHFDVANKVGQQDDFSGVVDAIIKDIVVDKKYEWVFLGALPLKLKQFVGNGIEFHNWCPITEYPEKIKQLNINCSIAPLQDNVFSRSKANIKLTEAGAQGIPCIAQNIACYNHDGWDYLFNNSEELFSKLAEVVQSEESYAIASDAAKKYSDKYILHDHLDELVLLYTTEYGDHKRRENPFFLNNNLEQLEC